MYSQSAFAIPQEQTVQEIEQERDELFFQLMNMRENIKEISRKWQVLGIEPDKHENWTVIFLKDDGYQCQVMTKSCKEKFDGSWDFAIQGHYYDRFSLHIDDIKGEPDQGMGSVCMTHLKSYVSEMNISQITGDIVKRDWDHLDRLIYFYEKHGFSVSIDENDQKGFIQGTPVE
ncbi:hypothetical protein [Salisediminibacterium selenitireducens]|uniref:GCN5-related N-acetyltransferase n=1 Tax=Bacillus selenitireducens (strain ATCC 700615 / DSM 15326 / MLS10) TaxID=439292 RepID=D6XUJ5_BACIE|nr:hypothetical protein [Salisediminibacterium selenitireducens]ADH99481.1 hypothetical protein Bsel_1977 [[Bacillus] selenitireducens MLS10]